MKAGKPNMRMGTAVLTAGCALCAAALALTPPAYASQNAQSIKEAGTEEVTFSPEESSASADSRVTGHIRVELISVVMPAGGLEFQVDTKAPFQVENPGAQIQSPGIQIRNLSVVPVRLEISQVAEIKDEDVKFSEKFSDQAEQSFQLVDQISKVGPMGTAILALGVSGQTYGSVQEFERQAFLPGRSGSIYITEIPAEGTIHLRLYGKVAPDFYGKYQFTVRPTLKISAAR